MNRSILGIAAIIVAMLIVGCGATTPSSAAATQPAMPTAAPTPFVPTPTPAPTPKPTPALTTGQQNAIGSAQDYLSMGSGWSRAGLIKQLSSSFGEGYSLADATFAVDSLHIDWNAQAVLSAKNYLALGHWSRNGLIQQLESSYGEGFTHAQAVYGVTHAGL